PPRVRLEGERLDPISIPDFYGGVVDLSLETMALLARDRDRMPFAGRVETEQRLLRRIDAIAAVPIDVVRATLAFWKKHVDAPYATWSATFALATLLGGDALAAVEVGLEAIGAEATAHA